MSNEENTNSVNLPKTNIKMGIANMINEYNNLPDNKEKLNYINSVVEWYMREKTLLSMSKTGDINENRYSSGNPYTNNFKKI